MKKYDHGDVIIRFDQAVFGYGSNHPILNGASFSLREGAKITLMGQNGAGKTTIFGLIQGRHPLDDGSVHIRQGATIATAAQVVSREDLEKNVREFFEGAFNTKVYDIEPRIKKILEVVHLTAPFDKKIKEFSGGQQARLLLAFALIQNPDILLLDEPTNNLDAQGIEHLTQFLIDYKKTCIVISHDANFLNAFTHGVLYLDIFTKQVEQYVGDYLKVVEEIAARIERERMKNVRLERDIANRKEQMSYFAQKGGKMRDVARKMKEAIEELEGQMVTMRQEDKTIKNFAIQHQNFEALDFSDTAGALLTIQAVSVIHNHKPVKKTVKVAVKKRQKLLISGPNGIGKSTFLESLAGGKKGHHSKAKSLTEASLTSGLIVGYYRQDFSGLDFEATVYKTLGEVAEKATDEEIRGVAAQFLFTSDLLKNKVGSLSEGQKGLLSFARFVLQKPGLLILDEPTNHINFRHLPVIAKALDRFEGGMILVSHMKEFVDQLKIDETLDLGAL